MPLCFDRFPSNTELIGQRKGLYWYQGIQLLCSVIQFVLSMLIIILIYPVLFEEQNDIKWNAFSLGLLLLTILQYSSQTYNIIVRVIYPQFWWCRKFLTDNVFFSIIRKKPILMFALISEKICRYTSFLVVICIITLLFMNSTSLNYTILLEIHLGFTTSRIISSFVVVPLWLKYYISTADITLAPPHVLIRSESIVESDSYHSVTFLTDDQLSRMGTRLHLELQQIETMKKNNEDLICPICMDDYHEGSDMKSLKCKHKFHTNCINSWFQMNISCPICKTLTDVI